MASDFDGVLAPLVDDPSTSRPQPASRDALVALGELPNTTAALISGRARCELLQLAGMPAHVEAVGSHGAEFAAGFDGGLEDAARALHTRIHDETARLVSGHEGVRLEVKPASVAVHVRMASAQVGAEVLDEVRAGPAAWDGVHTSEGKSVIELLVVDTDKGEALDVLRRGAGADAAFYMGDDVTDEHAFPAAARGRRGREGGRRGHRRRVPGGRPGRRGRRPGVPARRPPALIPTG